MGNKYKVSPPNERRHNGRTYASKAEMMYAINLYFQQDHGIILDFVEQPRLWLGVPLNKYVPDFLVIPRDERPFYVDVKGIETAAFKKNKKLWAAYGYLDLHVVKRKGNNFITSEIVNGNSN